MYQRDVLSYFCNNSNSDIVGIDFDVADVDEFLMIGNTCTYPHLDIVINNEAEEADVDDDDDDVGVAGLDSGIDRMDTIESIS
jgi:short-subunit dehydrogenase involved in D-alanine esterification of teichoic acids